MLSTDNKRRVLAAALLAVLLALFVLAGGPGDLAQLKSPDGILPYTQPAATKPRPRTPTPTSSRRVGSATLTRPSPRAVVSRPIASTSNAVSTTPLR